MYIKSMILDGFKSYGKRVEINNFDKEFNAITGLNGTGKSNILDAICFVLGISNMKQVRATSLQELVYKSGQAGVTKASVTIMFDNSDKSGSPMGYESYQEISVTRQIIIGGKNKYMINGINVTNQRVQDMFCSVQLNVNNPHFLIMQGRITKVLNMKPGEILSMIEEAAGTSMYETKKKSTIKTIQQKDGKLKEIDEILTEEIGPNLAKLKEDKAKYIEFQAKEREMEFYRKLNVALMYMDALKNSKEAEKRTNKVNDKLTAKEKFIVDSHKEVEAIELQLEELTKAKQSDDGSRLEALEKELHSTEKQEQKLNSEMKNNQVTIQEEESKVKSLTADVANDERALADKQANLSEDGGLFGKLKETYEKDQKDLVDAQENYQKISVGLLQNDNGENATLEQQLMQARAAVTEAQTNVKQCEMRLKHSTEQLKIREKDIRTTTIDYDRLKREYANSQAALNTLKANKEKLGYAEGSLEGLQQQQLKLKKEIEQLDDKIDSLEMGNAGMRFEYNIADRNFRKESVKGVLGKLITVKDLSTAYALEIAAGRAMYNVITDTEATGKLLLQKGNLRQRVTIVPLNKIAARAPIHQSTIDHAQRMVGKENVRSALSCIEYAEELEPAMNFTFGNVLICRDMNVARKLAYDRQIARKCVTLEGDVCDPGGVMSGGSAPKTGSVLLRLNEIKPVQNARNEKSKCMEAVNGQIAQVSQVAQRYVKLHEEYELKKIEVENLARQLEATDHHRTQEEIDGFKRAIVECRESIEASRRAEADNAKRAKRLEAETKDASNIRDRQLKEADKRMKALEKRAELSRKAWEEREREASTLDLEIKEMQKAIDADRGTIEETAKRIEGLKGRQEELRVELEQVQATLAQVREKVHLVKEERAKKNKEMQKLAAKREDIVKRRNEAELEVKRLNHELDSIKEEAKDSVNRIGELTRKYKWIEQEKDYFGIAGGAYDFTEHDPNMIPRKLQHLEELCAKLRRVINTKAMILLDKEEESYDQMMKKKTILNNDKAVLYETMKALDEKKEETLLKAWEQVNKDFGSIFNTLLPGSNAKLEMVNERSVLDGLEVKVGFSGTWKESLGELSGGQRSLVALSLVLAMLLFKPAPLYILDEVDAALDVMHTANIGKMLKKHFTKSQFIIVSLKDGMFNNANVLYQTKFVDGFSAVVRTEKSNRSK